MQTEAGVLACDETTFSRVPTQRSVYIISCDRTSGWHPRGQDNFVRVV